jgi:deoxyadenosine/deoxycytidine kinase
MFSTMLISGCVGLGCKVLASQLEEKELKAYRQIEQEEMDRLLNTYVNHCRSYLKVSQLFNFLEPSVKFYFVLLSIIVT